MNVQRKTFSLSVCFYEYTHAPINTFLASVLLGIIHLVRTQNFPKT